MASGEIYIFDIALTRLLDSLQVGGERAYGYGRMGAPTIVTADSSFHGHSLILDEDVEVTLAENLPFPAFVKWDQTIRCSRGEVEAVVGREWRETGELGVGEHLSPCEVCWAPGSVLECEAPLKLGPYGIWYPA